VYKRQQHGAPAPDITRARHIPAVPTDQEPDILSRTLMAAAQHGAPVRDIRADLHGDPVQDIPDRTALRADMVRRAVTVMVTVRAAITTGVIIKPRPYVHAPHTASALRSDLNWVSAPNLTLPVISNVILNANLRQIPARSIRISLRPLTILSTAMSMTRL